MKLTSIIRRIELDTMTNHQGETELVILYYFVDNVVVLAPVGEFDERR